MEQGIQNGQQSSSSWSMDRILGHGSYGFVSLWINKTTNQHLAVKKFEVRTSSPPSARLLQDLQDRYRKEVDIMYNQIDTPYIVSTIPAPSELIANYAAAEELKKKTSSKDDGENSSEATSPTIDTNLPLLCMEFCKGGDLRQMLKRPENLCGLPEREVLRVLSDISNAISYLHNKNICHRDIKPENIVIQYADNSYTKQIYKLSDLGFAKDFANDSQFSTILGTLPYLAPEVYYGSKYDKTVDYWSFGLIAFEVCCGVRPFLPGESPAVWIPLVEKKAKDVIAIYRGEDGTIKYSNDIHYNNHLSQLIKKCIVAWLPSMLQLDPLRRGKYVITPEEAKRLGNGESSALNRLFNMLNTKFLHIHTLTDRHVFAIGTRTKISDVQTWIDRSIGIPPHEQLILTTDGVDVTATPSVLAVKYLELSSDLFLLSKKVVETTMKMKLPKSLKYYLNTWDEQHEPLKIRKVWVSSIYFVQTHVERATSIKKSAEALRIYHSQSCTAELKILVNSVEKASYSLNNLAELEEKLEELEDHYKNNLQLDGVVLESISSLKQEGENLKEYSKECFATWVETINLKTIQVSELEEIYHKLIKAYDMWKTVEGEGKCFEMKILVTLICNFITSWDPVINSLLGNVKILIEKINVDDSLKQKLCIVISKLNSLMDTVIDRRLKKQKFILSRGFSNGEEISSNNSFEDVVVNGNGSSHNDEKSESTNSSVQLMSQSQCELPSNSRTPRASGKLMSQSCYVGSGSRKNSLTPDFIKLMDETMKIKEDVEENCNNAISKVEEILKKKSVIREPL